jgi:hypothetical protein
MSQTPIIRITADGAWRVTSSGDVRITGILDVPEFDVAAVVDLYFPGIVVQKNLTDAITLFLIEHDGVVAEADVPAILALANALLVVQDTPSYLPTTQDNYAGLPPYPAGMVRIPNSNPTPGGWTIVDDGTVVTGNSP